MILTVGLERVVLFLWQPFKNYTLLKKEKKKKYDIKIKRLVGKGGGVWYTGAGGLAVKFFHFSHIILIFNLFSIFIFKYQSNVIYANVNYIYIYT